MLRSARLLGTVTALATAGVTAVASAHDFWLVPDAFQVAGGGTLTVEGRTSSNFPASLSAVTTDRIAAAEVIGAAGRERIGVVEQGPSVLRLRHRPAAAGQYVVAVQLQPRSVRESAAGFRRYLDLEGAPDALARVEREGLLRGRDSVTRRYAKYAKTIVEVGDGGRAWASEAGHPLEFVPTTDPARWRAGDTATVVLRYRGAPLPGIRVHADQVAWPAADAVTARRVPPRTIDLRTDGAGQVRVLLDRAGLWNVRTIHVVQADAGSGADWDTHWATLVVRVPAR
jgi:uncharacterized GH25 family protein